MRQLTTRYALVMALYWANLAVLSNYASVYLLARGFGNASIGLMIAVSSLVSAVLQPLLGALADGKHSPSVRALLLSLIVLFLASAALIPVAAGRSGFFLAFAYGASLMLITTMCPFNNALGTLAASAGENISFGIARGVGSLSYALISIVMGRLITRWNPSFIPAVAIFVYVLYAGAVLFFPNAENTTAASPKAEKGEAFFSRYPGFGLILAAAVCLYTSHTAISNFGYQIISSKGGDSASLGVAFAIAAVLELPLMFGFSSLLKIMPARKWLVVSGIAYIAKTLGTALVPSVSGFYAVQTLQILSYAVITVASVYYIAETMAPWDAVKGQALFTMTNTVGGVFASALGGFLLDGGGVPYLLAATVAFAVLGTLLMAAGVSRAGRQANP